MTETRLQIAPEVHARQFDDELVILDLASGYYFGLNEVGAALWSGIARNESLEQIVETITHRFDVTAARARIDVDALVAELVARKLLLRSAE